ncbi:MAG: hypothetical protein AAFN77_15115 [Planctomycetota bacterium]
MSAGKRRPRTPSDEIDETSINSDHDSTSSETQKTPRRKRRWIALILLMAFVFLLPNLIGWTGLHQTAINYYLSDFSGSVEVDSMSTGWFQSVTLDGISITDANGETVVRATKIKTSATLWQFITGQGCGTVTATEPDVFLAMRPDGSNLEDLIAELTAGPPQEPLEDPPAGQALPDVQLNIQSGRVLMTSSGVATAWQLEELDGAIRTGAAEAPLLINLQTKVIPVAVDAAGNGSPGVPGNIIVAGQVDAGQPLLTFDAADFVIEMEQLPISVAGPPLQRVLGPTATAGRLSGEAKVFYSGKAQSLAVHLKRINGQSLGLASPSLLGEDQLEVQTLGADGEVRLTPNLVFAEEFSVDSELGKVTANGNFDLQQLSQLARQGQLGDSSFQMDGQIDLAQVVRMLPSTLKLHEDLEVTDGQITFQVNSQAGDALDGQNKRIVMNLDTANLRAKRSGREIVWAKPIRVVGTVAEANGQLTLQDLSCESEFLNLTGNGNLQSASFEFDGNLKTLVDRIKQFVELDETELAGMFDGQFGWQVVPATQIDPLDPLAILPLRLGGQLNVQQPLIEVPGVPRWQPESLSLKVSAKGTSLKRTHPVVGTVIDKTQSLTSFGYQLDLDEGGAQLDIGRERAVATLSGPMSDALQQTNWKANCQITGELERWLAHVRNVVDLGEMQGAGTLNLVSSIALAENQLEFDAAQYRIDDLVLTGYGMSIDEPSAEGVATGLVDLNQGSLKFDDVTLISNTVSARGRNLNIAYPSNLRIEGDLAYRANVNRLADWFELSPDAESLFWFGNAEGNVHLSSDEYGITFQTDSTLKDLVAASQTLVEGQATGPLVQASNPQRQWTAIWQEPKLRLLGGVQLGNDFDSVTLRSAEFQSGSFSGNVDGTVKEIASRMAVDVRGKWKPDWSKINGLVAQYAGNSLLFEGNQEQAFAIRGPLFTDPGVDAVQQDIAVTKPTIVSQPQPWVPEDLQAGIDLGWERGTVLGLPVGASQLDLRLEQGLAKVTTKGIPFAGGTIGFAPVIDLRGSEPVITSQWTRLLDNVELRPDTARQWLQYVAPLAADATSAQGNLTVDVGEARIPVFNPQQIQARGAVKLSNVVIGAGPVAEQLLGTVKQVRQLLKPDAKDRDLNTWLRLDEQTVPIVVRDGRVFHDKLDFSHDDLVIRTRGSVGFDQTLQLVAEIPIADEWIAGKKWLAGLQGQSLTVPVNGTVTQPKLDRSAIEQLSRNLVNQAAKGAVDNVVEDKLNPKLNEFQQKLNEKINGKFNQFQQDLQEKLGIGGDENGGANGLLPKNPGSLLPDPKQLIPGLLPNRNK